MTVVLVAIATSLVAACGGVPTSSSPRAVRALGQTSQAPSPQPTPQPGALPANIVKGFLQANVSTADDKHSAAKQFLTQAGRSRWSDSTATIVHVLQAPAPLGGCSTSPTCTTTQVTMTGIKVGSLSPNGTYSPQTVGDGTDADQLQLYPTSTSPNASNYVSFNFVLRKQPDGQWRIDVPPPGLIIQDSQFVTAYHPLKLYYFEGSGQRLVADLRYTALVEQTQATWLLAQLLAGARPELANAVLPFPDQINSKTATVVRKSDGTMALELPGSSQLVTTARTLLAAQLAATYGQPLLNDPITITDDGKPLQIPAISQPYTVSDFPLQTGSYQSSPLAYYLNSSGAIVESDPTQYDQGSPVNGALGQGHPGLTSIAVGRSAPNSTNNPVVAATVGVAGRATLEVGSLNGLSAVTAIKPGPLTRPAWAPFLPSQTQEVWIGDGALLYRVTVGKTSFGVSSVQLNLHSGASKKIVSVRISPDGARIAVVALSSDATAEIYVGTIERSATSVHVTNPVAISPDDADITDVAWNDDVTLYACGSSSGVPGVWSVQSDGANWTPSTGADLLIAIPTQISAATDAYRWLAAGGSLLVQRLQSWDSPDLAHPEKSVRGTSPTYLQ